MIKIIKDKNLIEYIFDYNVILFSMGINNSMGNNFSYEIGLNFPEVKEHENNMNYGDKRKLGTINETKMDNIIFCACYIHNGNKKNMNLTYDYLRSCLKLINNKYSGKKIACPIIGGNEYDGNGDREEIEKIFDQECNKCEVFLYDCNTEPFSTVMFRKIAALHKKLKNKEIDSNEYIKERSRIEWVRKNGIYKEIPEDFEYIPRQDKKKIRFIGKIEKEI